MRFGHTATSCDLSNRWSFSCGLMG